MYLYIYHGYKMVLASSLWKQYNYHTFVLCLQAELNELFSIGSNVENIR